MPLKRWGIRQNRETCGTAGFVSLGQHRRVEIRTDQPLGRRSLLHLRNQRVIAVSVFLPDRADKATRRRRGLRPGFEARQRMRTLGGGDLLALVSLDLVQDVGHATLADRWKPRSIVSAASPPRRCPAI